jgi:hypothetical protein
MLLMEKLLLILNIFKDMDITDAGYINEARDTDFQSLTEASVD